MTELGNRLKEAREAKGLSLSDVQEMTKIQKRYLKGIEEGNYDMMPGKFYIRAFIKQYSEAVGLNPEEIFNEYKSEIPSSHEDEIPQRATKVESVNTQVTREPSKILEHLPKILVTAFVIGALFLVWVLIPKSNTSDQDGKNTVVQQTEEENQSEVSKEEEVLKKEKPAKEQPKVEESKQTLESVGSSGRKATYSLANTEKFVVSITSKGSTWIGVEDGTGKKYFADMIPAGKTETFDLAGQSEVKIIVGNALDTEIKVNDEALTYQIPAATEVRQDIIIQKSEATQ